MELTKIRTEITEQTKITENFQILFNLNQKFKTKNFGKPFLNLDIFFQFTSVRFQPTRANRIPN